MKFKLLIITLLFVSCHKQTTTHEKHESDSTKIIQNFAEDSSKLHVINFDLNSFKEIAGYKNIDFETDKYSYDKYLQNIDSADFQLECPNITDLMEKIDNEKEFLVETDYGKVRFKSVDKGDLFLYYHYLNELTIADFNIIVLYGIDSPNTIFLHNKIYGGFTTNGIINLSPDKKYFVSFSNTPDYCLMEIYKVDGDNIINVVNLYSEYYPIENICWHNDLLIETASIKNIQYYYRINWTQILNDFFK